jgi:molecular chaperone DnaK (HSP70)
MLKNIPNAKKGVPRFDTTFEIDANGILQVTAQLKGSDEIYKITISKALNMNQEEVDESAKKTQGLLKEKAILEEVSRQQQLLCDLCNNLLDEVKDKNFQKICGDIADWCDNTEHPGQKLLEEKINALKDGYKKATGKDLKTSFEGPSFDDVDDDLLN